MLPDIIYISLLSKKAGGHLLDQLQNVRAEIHYTPEFKMVLPNSDEFRQADLGMETRRSGAGGKIVGIVSPHKKHREGGNSSALARGNQREQF